MIHHKASWVWVWVGAAVTALLGCSGDSATSDGSAPNASPESIRQVEQALTSEQQRILGLDSPQQDWTTTQGSIAQVGALTQGSAALRVAHPDGEWTTLCTQQMSPLGPIGSTVSIDYQLDQETPWFGVLHFVVKLPVAGHDWVDLGEVSIQGKAPGVTHTASWNLSPVSDGIMQSIARINFRRLTDK